MHFIKFVSSNWIQYILSYSRFHCKWSFSLFGWVKHTSKISSNWKCSPIQVQKWITFHNLHFFIKGVFSWVKPLEFVMETETVIVVRNPLVFRNSRIFFHPGKYFRRLIWAGLWEHNDLSYHPGNQP